MSQLTLELNDTLLRHLRERAARNTRSVEAEAVSLLTEALPEAKDDPWAAVKAIHAELKATGRDFGDSVEALREDRNR